MCWLWRGSATPKDPAALAVQYEGMCDGYDAKTGATQVTAKELMAWIEEESRGGPRVIIYDTRGQAEHDVSTLPSAQLLPPAATGMAKAMANVGSLTFNAPTPSACSIPADARVVCHCTAGLRSGFACRALEKQWQDEGVDRTAFNLRGGIISWVNAGGTVVDPGTGAQRQAVHTYSKTWQAFVVERDGMRAVIQ